MKTTVYKGTLHGMGEGTEARGQVTTHTSTVVSGAVVGGGFVGSANTRTKERYHKDQQEGFIRRACIEVGDATIKNLMVQPRMDRLLLDAVGQEVGLSVAGRPRKRIERQTLIAVYTPASGLVKPPFVKLVLASAWSAIQTWIFGAVIGGAIATFILWIVFGLIGRAMGMQTAGVFTGLALGGLVVLWFLLLPLRTIYAVFRARKALDNIPFATG